MLQYERNCDTSSLLYISSGSRTSKEKATGAKYQAQKKPGEKKRVQARRKEGDGTEPLQDEVAVTTMVNAAKS